MPPKDAIKKIPLIWRIFEVIFLIIVVVYSFFFGVWYEGQSAMIAKVQAAAAVFAPLSR